MTSASLGRGPSGREHPRLIGLVMRRAHVEVKQNDRRNAGIQRAVAQNRTCIRRGSGYTDRLSMARGRGGDA